jgi:hypothetical protein
LEEWNNGRMVKSKKILFHYPIFQHSIIP